MKLPAWIVVLSVLVVLVGANFPASAQSSETLEDRVARVQKLIDERVSSLLAGDKARFMQTVDPSASASYRDSQSLSFDGWRSVPVVELVVRLRLEDSGDLAKGLKLAEKHGADDALLSETRTTYRLADYDDRPALNTSWTTYVRRGGSWFVAADDDARHLGLDNTRELWDFGPLVFERTPHFLVMTRPDQTGRGRMLASIAEDAFDVFDRRWSERWSKRVPLLIPASVEQVEEILHTTADLENFSAFTVYVPYRDGGWRTGAPRMYAQEANLADRSRGLQVETMVHELAHAAAAELSGPYTPTWQHEGLAEWIRLGKPTTHRPEASVSLRLPEAEAFTSGDASQLRIAYTLSASATTFLAEQKGSGAPLALMKEIGSKRTVAGSSSYNVNAAFEKVTGMSISDFEKAWATRYP